MIKIGSIVWGVSDVQRAVAFWSSALNYKPMGKKSEDWEILVPIDGEGPQLAISLVSSTAQNHQRHHLDLYSSDKESEIERLLSLGAKKVDWKYPSDADYTVLADPDGNRFCVIQNIISKVI